MMGITQPNTTQTPNVIFDELLPLMKEAELRVTMVIVRKTFGWHKDEDELSLSQLMRLTGMGRQGVLNGIEDGMKRGTIKRREIGQSFLYSMDVHEVDQSTKETETSPLSRPELVHEVDTQKKPKETKEKDSAPKPEKAKERQRNPVYEAIAEVFFGIKDFHAINGDGARIGKIWGWLKKAEPDVTPERVRAFGVWYDTETEDRRTGNPISRPKDLAKVQEWWARFRQSGDKPEEIDGYTSRRRV